MGQSQSDSYEHKTGIGAGTQSPRDLPRDNSREQAACPQVAQSAKRTPKRAFVIGYGKRGDNNQGTQKGHNIVPSDNNQTNGRVGGSSRFKKNLTANDRMTLEQQQRHIRKLSNVSNRNIQLLSMKPRGEKECYAEGLRSRRRSSLINLILGAPSRGPRFSEDLCSLSSRMSELCNFGIDYFPDTIHSQTSSSSNNNNGRPIPSSISSSLVRLEDGFALHPGASAAAASDASSPVAADFNVMPVGSRSLVTNNGDFRRRRRSSLGSLTSFESAQIERSGFFADTNRHNPFDGADSSHQCIRNVETDVLAKNGGHPQAQQEVGAPPGDNGAKGGRELSDSNPVSILSHGQHQLWRHSSSDEGSQQQASGRRGPSLSSMFLASVDLTSSLDCSDATGGQNRLASTTRQPGDDQLTRAGQEEGYYFNGQVGAGHERKTKTNTTVSSSLLSPALMESGRDSGCSASSSSPSPLLASFTKLGTGDASGFAVAPNATTNGAPPPAAGSVMANEKSATQAANRAAAFAAKGRINHGARRMIHRSGSELSLYSSTTSSSLSHNQLYYHHVYPRHISRGSIRSVMLEAGSGGTGEYGCVGGLPKDIARSHPPPPPHQSVNDRPMTKGLATATTTHMSSHLHETKLIIMLQVCLPFILAGFGNMAAGLVLNQIAHWEAFRHVPIFFVLLPSFVGLKGNIEMTLASRLSTLSNLNLLDTSYQRRHAFLTNLILILSQAIGLSIFASIASVVCEFGMGKLDEMNVSNIINIFALIVLPSALVTSTTLVIISSIVMWFAIWLAKQLQVNPDNLSTLMAALYGDVSCVLTYGLFAQLMYSLNQQGATMLPMCIIALATISWPLFWWVAYQCRETHELALSSMPPMLAAITVSLGSGAVLSLVVDKFSRIALYQPVVNGFGANLIAVQASRVSTWLWCTALRRLSVAAPLTLAPPPPVGTKTKNEFGFEFEPNVKIPYGSLASFVELPGARVASVMSKQMEHKQQNASAGLADKLNNLSKLLVNTMKMPLWSFYNSSPNSVAARLLMVMLIPAHSLYFVVIWLVAPENYIIPTWPFYLIYISLCLTQVFVLLSICQPLMTLLMNKHLDPDIFGISLLMALADLIGTLCLTGAFHVLASIGDPNAT